MRVLLTAGFDRALHSIALAELVRRDGHEVAGVLVVSPFRAKRLRSVVRRRGARFVVGAARRLLGLRASKQYDAVEALLQSQRIAARSLRAWCAAHGVERRVVADLDSPDAIDFARSLRVDGTLYTGGGILRREFIAAASGRVLNAHSGPLPRVRGMNACEWSLLLGERPSVSIHWIDEGIDTGAALEVIPVPLRGDDDLEALRGRCTLIGIDGLRRHVAALGAPLPARAATAAPSRQCFVLAPALRELAETRLVERAAALARSR